MIPPVSLTTVKKTPAKKGRSVKTPTSKKSVSHGSTLKQSITIKPGEEIKASHPAVVMELLTVALDRVTAEDRNAIAAKYGLKPHNVHMVSCFDTDAILPDILTEFRFPTSIGLIVPSEQLPLLVIRPLDILLYISTQREDQSSRPGNFKYRQRVNPYLMSEDDTRMDGIHAARERGSGA